MTGSMRTFVWALPLCIGTCAWVTGLNPRPQSLGPKNIIIYIGLSPPPPPPRAPGGAKINSGFNPLETVIIGQLKNSIFLKALNIWFYNFQIYLRNALKGANCLT